MRVTISDGYKQVVIDEILIKQNKIILDAIYKTLYMKLLDIQIDDIKTEIKKILIKRNLYII